MTSTPADPHIVPTYILCVGRDLRVHYARADFAERNAPSLKQQSHQSTYGDANKPGPSHRIPIADTQDQVTWSQNDYFLILRPLRDDVADFHHDNDGPRDLTTNRSVIHGSVLSAQAPAILVECP